MTSLPHQIITRSMRDHGPKELLTEAKQLLDYAPSSEAERIAAEEQRNEFRRDAYLVQRAMLGADVIASQLLDMAKALGASHESAHHPRQHPRRPRCAGNTGRMDAG